MHSRDRRENKASKTRSSDGLMSVIKVALSIEMKKKKSSYQISNV